MGSIIDRLTGLGLSERLARGVAAFGLFLVIMALIAAALAVSRCSNRSQEAAQGRVSAGQAGAFTNSTADAIAVSQAAHARESASDALSRTNEEEIRAAEGANDKVNPAIRDAGIAALCRRQAYRNDPRCKGRQ